MMILEIFKKYGVQLNPHLPLFRGNRELDLILELITPEMTIVEIGAYAGAATEIFARKAKFVFAVDPWECGYDDGDIASKINGDVIEEIFDWRCGKLPNVTKMKMTSAEAAQFIPKVDLVYLDGNHHDVARDLAIWSPKTTIMCGHDYTWASVRDAIGKVRLLDGSNWVK